MMDHRKTKITVSLRTKLIGGILLAILFTVAAVSTVFVIISYNNAQNSAGRVYENLSFNIADFADKNIEEVHKKLSAFGQIASIADPATPVDERVTVSRAAAPALGDDVSVKMTDLDGKELVLSSEDEIDLSDRAYIQAALNGNTFVTSPFFSPIVNRMVLVIAQPLKWNNEIVGAIFMLLPGDFLNEAIEAAKAGYEGYACAFDSSGSLISHKDIIGILERRENQYIEMAKTDKSYEGMAEAVKTMLAQKNGTLIYTNPENEKMLGGFTTTSHGWVVLVCSTVSDVLTDTNHAIKNAIIASVICMLVVASLAFCLLGKIVKRVSLAALRLDQMARGDLITAVPETKSGSEEGGLVRSLGEVVGMMNAYISDITNTLVAIEKGRLDYASEQEYKGDFTAIKKALTGITSSLSSTMGSIMEFTAQVSTGTKQFAENAASIAGSATQMANGAQELAEGASKQAASVEEVSISIAEIAEKTKANADMTGKTSKLADTIINKAGIGSHQMNEMITAVNDINDASKSVSDIMETINGIAEQINLLSLNAAIEAARAGEHGRGFAVVAEEVRKLATESKKAVNETSSITQNSIQKAELGVRVAGEMSESLADIIAGINESKGLIMEIAKASEEQLTSISHINISIEQVAKIVQQNSALAQESAATAEENAAASERNAAIAEKMSSQSDMLEELISQFKLKNDRTGLEVRTSGAPRAR